MLRSQWVMSRMKWLSLLQALFDQLKHFEYNHQRHVQKENFLTALKKIKQVLPLEAPEKYYETQGAIAIPYAEVNSQFDELLPQYVTWDHIIDVLLYKSITANFSGAAKANESVVLNETFAHDEYSQQNKEESYVEEVPSDCKEQKLEPLTSKVTILSNPTTLMSQKPAQL